jgi:Fur family peroxide stress response transcriptional regulator
MEAMVEYLSENDSPNRGTQRLSSALSFFVYKTITAGKSDQHLVARVANLQQRLSDGGHRITPQRVHILRALLTANHPTAEEVWEEVRQISPTTSLGTIYKTLDTLKEMGEVRELETRDDRHHYDALRPSAHPHVVCNQCGKIDDVDIDGLVSLQTQATEASGYDIKDQQVTFYGLCRDCRD